MRYPGKVIGIATHDDTAFGLLQTGCRGRYSVRRLFQREIELNVILPAPRDLPDGSLDGCHSIDSGWNEGFGKKGDIKDMIESKHSLIRPQLAVADKIPAPVRQTT